MSSITGGELHVLDSPSVISALTEIQSFLQHEEETDTTLLPTLFGRERNQEGAPDKALEFSEARSPESQLGSYNCL